MWSISFYKSWCHLFSSSHHSPKLSEIDVSYNGISRLNEGTFGMLTHLSVLDLSHNSLLIVESNAFVGMNITHLDIGYNSLRQPPTLPLRKLEFTKTLILDSNQFVMLEEGSISSIRAEFISMSNCNHLLRFEERAIKNMPQLKTLTMNGNQRLTYIDPLFISHVPRVIIFENLSYMLTYHLLICDVPLLLCTN